MQFFNLSDLSLFRILTFTWWEKLLVQQDAFLFLLILVWLD